MDKHLNGNFLDPVAKIFLFLLLSLIIRTIPLRVDRRIKLDEIEKRRKSKN